MTKTILLTAVAALALSVGSASANQRHDGANKGDGCIRHIVVGGKRVDIVEGLPEGKCLVRVSVLRGKVCLSGRAAAEPASDDALGKHPIREGIEDAGYHFRCLN